MSSTYSTVGGGDFNVASGEHSTVGGGIGNTANDQFSTVGGGFDNDASGIDSTVGGGTSNIASGDGSTVPGGVGNAPIGNYSMAMGRGAVVNGSGSFLFADGSSSSAVTTSTPNEFVVAATGGIAMRTTRNFTNLCRLSAGGGSWACSSDRRFKRDFAPVDTGAVLQEVVALPITTWRFQTQPAEIRHMGPMAQDFRAAFQLSSDDTTITHVDVNGVALAAIQALHTMVRERDGTIARQADVLQRVQAEFAELRTAVRHLLGASGPR